MSKVVIYARHTGDVEGSTTVAEQIQACTKEAQEAGAEAEVFGVYSDDAPINSTDPRTGLMELLRDAKAGEFDIVITEGLDCLARDENNLTQINQRLARAHVAVCTLLDGNELCYQITAEKVHSAKVALSRLYRGATQWAKGLETLITTEGGQAHEIEIKRLQAGFQEVVRCDHRGYAQPVPVQLQDDTQTQAESQNPESQMELAYE